MPEEELWQKHEREDHVEQAEKHDMILKCDNLEVDMLRNFILGIRESRADVTTSIDSDAYERGRRFARWITRY